MKINNPTLRCDLSLPLYAHFCMEICKVHTICGKKATTTKGVLGPKGIQEP
jgi:hypothetical protein